ncbi:undecaprenyl-phosphate glucose phosphotransferase [Reinekea thalattae]|uniref:Undecaprenyl-phosphate glucose phosphotransferase n=1 Tax=Reinekea thalattae TaxID=2593301 RepID=A0A5C8Z923_9GAMM|nr:undecaprenyl-phosphate glucose phosphotransferase [Reinekea thalattae]TXR53350.1 undecaprenyl-phosphate glucose phosphotransferase [Reinekea thalattae]
MKTPTQCSGLFFRAADLIIVTSIGYITYWARFNTWQLQGEYKNILALGAVIMLLICSHQKIYQSWRGHYGFSLFSRLSTCWLTSSLLLICFILFSHQGEYYSRLWLGTWLVGSWLSAITIRLFAYYILAIRRTKGGNKSNVFIFGGKDKASQIENQFKLYNWAGFRISGTLDLKDACKLTEQELLYLVGDSDEVWITASIKNSEKVSELYYKLQNCTKNIRYVPNLSDLRLLNHKVGNIVGLHTIDLSTSPLDGSSGLIKRLEDLFLGSLIFIGLLPIMLVIAIAVKLTSKGPVIFKQHRHGIDGKPIKIYKFRSMKVHQEENNEVTQAKKNDSRLTPIGGFLRKTSLDELPQFYNVIQGRMSIVGPRPHAIQHNEYYANLVQSYMKRHKVKPGITGWAQVNGLRGETDTLDKMEKRVEHDLFYIDNWSFWFDIKIITLTILYILRHKNAY